MVNCWKGQVVSCSVSCISDMLVSCVCGVMGLSCSVGVVLCCGVVMLWGCHVLWVLCCVVGLSCCGVVVFCGCHVMSVLCRYCVIVVSYGCHGPLQ